MQEPSWYKRRLSLHACLSIAGAPEALHTSNSNDLDPTIVVTNTNQIPVWNVPPPPGLQLGTYRTGRHSRESSPTAWSVLVVRVTAQDGEPDYSVDQLYQLNFQDDVSLKQQLHKCSFGTLHLEPTSNGVLDVTIKMNADKRRQRRHSPL
jgi:hypothetical protein